MRPLLDAAPAAPTRLVGAVTGASGELAYGLYRRTIHPEVLPTVRSRIFDAPGFRARLALVAGGGHLVEVAAPRGEPRRALLELVAPLSFDLPAAGRVELRSLEGAAEEPIRDRSGLGYEARCAVQRLDPDRFRRACARLRGAPLPSASRLLDERLDGGHGGAPGLPPFSLLDALLTEEALETTAAHAFPAEGLLVVIRSTFAPRARWSPED